jgi:hypothetical protein
MSEYPNIATCHDCGIDGMPTRKHKIDNKTDAMYAEEVDICPICYETVLGREKLGLRQAFAVLLRELRNGK